MLEDMPSYLNWIEQFGRASTEARTLVFCGAVLLSALVCYGSPLLTAKASKPNSRTMPSPDRQTTVTVADEAATAKNELVGASQKNVVTAPIRIDQLSANSSGPVQAVMGNNLQAPKEFAGIQVTVLGNAPLTINLGNDFSIQKQSLKINTNVNGQAEIEIYTLFNSASWSYRSSSKLVNYRDKNVDLEQFLSSTDFLDEAKGYNAIFCLGLASGIAQGDITKTAALSDERATDLCGLVSRRIYGLAKQTRVFGLPLGYHKKSHVKQNSREEREQRSVVILGIETARGTLETEAEQHRVIDEILKNDGLGNFKSSDYSEVALNKPLRYLRIERGVYEPEAMGE